DHGGGADGRGDPGGQCGGRADAADARAHPAGAPGGGALHRGVSEQGGQGGRQGAVGPGGAGGAGAGVEVRVSGGQDSGDHGGGVGGRRPTQSRVVRGVEVCRKVLDGGMAGDNIGVLLRGTKKEDVERGMVLAKPKTITPHTKFKAEVYVLTKEEGGRHTPFF